MRAIGGGDYELASLHVAESHRRRGIGSSVVRQLVDQFVATHGSEHVRTFFSMIFCFRELPGTQYIDLVQVLYSGAPTTSSGPGIELMINKLEGRAANR